MTNMQNTTTGLPKGWTLASAHEAIIDSVIDHHRFANLGDRALALYEGDEGHELFPSSEELSARGVNLETLVTAFNNGLTGEGFAELLSTMTSVDSLNGNLELFNEHHEDVARHPDLVDRVMHRYGECSCH
jgi:hypothetical protein